VRVEGNAVFWVGEMTIPFPPSRGRGTSREAGCTYEITIQKNIVVKNFEPILTLLELEFRLRIDHYVASDMGLSCVSTLITGRKAGVWINPSWLNVANG
jgi:hypothetical protein